MQRIVINTRFGGFGISELAYEKLIEWGVPVQAYKEQVRDPETGLYLPEPANDGEVIFDRDLCCSPSGADKAMRRLSGRYWDNWIGSNRTHPLLLRVVEELGSNADGQFASLKIVDIPDGIEWEVDEYDGNESVEEVHRSWS